MNDDIRARMTGGSAGPRSVDGVVKRPIIPATRAVVKPPVQRATPPSPIQQVIDKPLPSSVPSRRRLLTARLLNASMITFLVIGSFVFYDTWRTNSDVKQQTASASSEDSGGATDERPSEIRPDVTDYRVAPDLPRMLKIPSIKVDARVLRLGVKANNQLKAPTNIFDAGWYEGSAKPGEAGAVVIDGHVQGPTQPGVFSRLKELKPGQTIQIEKGDGSLISYAVIKSRQYDYDKVDMAAVITPVETGKNGLNIITCGGKYDKQTNQYEKRLVVFASQL